MKQKPWISVIPVIIGVFMVMIDVSILNVALPKIAEEFNASASDVQWILNAYTVTLVVLLILAGKIGDMVSRNYYYSAGMAIFTNLTASIKAIKAKKIAIAIGNVINGFSLTSTDATIGLDVCKYPPSS